MQDFILGLLELYRQHSSNNISAVVVRTLTNFRVDKALVSYFILNNAYNNNTTVNYLASIYSFNASKQRLRCCYYILNLRA
jgi:hypothetical protein